MKEIWKNFVDTVKNGEYTNREAVLFSICLFLTGIVIGMIFSPKKYLSVGNNNGCNNCGPINGLSCDENEN